LEINKELSPQEIEIANKLRSAGTKVLGQMINNMMETPLDPAVEKAIKKAEEEELPVTNIKDEEAKEEAEPASKEKKKDTGKTIGWVVLGGLALIGAIAFVKRPRQQNQITNQAVENTENAVNKTTSSQDVSQPAEPPTPAPKPKLRPEEILAQYNDVDSFSGALMDMLNDKEVPAPKSESKDKYANIPTAKDVFGPASY
jgi:cytoskeletal protein RodZ